jgi:hypothetical protein
MKANSGGRLNVGSTGDVEVPSKSCTVIVTAFVGSLLAMATFLTFRCVEGAGESVGPGDGAMTYVPGAVMTPVEGF